jgi:hypothetical protein
LLLLQVPPLTPPVRVNVTVEPLQTEEGPPSVPVLFARLTAITWAALAVPQPLETVYVMVALPAATPVMTPVVELTVAAAVLLLLQAPPLAPLLV